MKLPRLDWLKGLLLVVLGMLLGYLLLFGGFYWLYRQIPATNCPDYAQEFCSLRLQQVIYPAMMKYAKAHGGRFSPNWTEQKAWEADLLPYLNSLTDLECPYKKNTLQLNYRFNRDLAGERLEDLRDPDKFFIRHVWLVSDLHAEHPKLALMLDRRVESVPLDRFDYFPMDLYRRSSKSHK